MLTAMLAVVLGAFVAGPASADSTACTPDPATGCLNLRVNQPGTGALPDVDLTVEGGGETFEVTTGADGSAQIAVTEAGEYTVTLDEATLPEGTVLREGTANPLTVNAELGGRVSKIFPVEGGDAAGGGTTTGGSNRHAQLVANGLVFGILLALASLGANLIYGTTGLSNFAHGEFVTFGGMLAYFSVQRWGLPLWSAIIISTIGGAVLGYLLNALIFGPLRRRGVGVTQQMIVTIGLAMASVYTIFIILGENPVFIVRGISARIQLGPVSLSGQTLASLAIAVVVLAAVALTLSRTRLGRATRAVSDNPALAAASGIKVESIISWVWVSSVALASLGGVLLGLYLNSTGFDFGSSMLLLMFAAITLGGLGSPLGAVLGAVIIGLVVELSTLILPSDMRYASGLAILIIVLLVRPQGILGRAERIG